MNGDAAAIKQHAATVLNGMRGSIVALSHRLHAFPEIGYEEERATRWLCESLTSAGFAVEPTVAGLPTAFVARTGVGPLRVAFLAEYDALPGMGHACGHNMIAAAAYGAATSLASIADDLGLTVSVVGTPAEEQLSNGGKIVMLKHGVFDDVDIAMMIHPTPFECAAPLTSAATSLQVVMSGHPAHAGAAPHQGRNAGDALTIAQVAIGLLRQHLTADTRISGITTLGGEAANVIPARTEADYVLRAQDANTLASLKERVAACFEAGALASGCHASVEGGDRPYAELRSYQPLVSVYERNASLLGRTFDSPERLDDFVPSTDAGNVSQILPLIHPYVGIGSWPVVNHQPEFAAICATPTADDALLGGATALAWTAIDLATDDELRAGALQARVSR